MDVVNAFLYKHRIADIMIYGHAIQKLAEVVKCDI